MLTLNFAPETTGIAPYAAGLATGLQDRGHEVQVLTAYPHYPQWRVPEGYDGLTLREDVDGVAVTRLRHHVPSTPSGVRRALSEVSFGLRLAAARWHAPDVVVCTSPALISSAMALSTATLRRRPGRPAPATGVIVQDLYSVGVRETAAGGDRVAQVLGALEGATLRRADGVAVIHDRFRDRVVDHLGVSPERVATIRNWTHVEPAPAFDRAAFRAAMGWRPDETVVLHTGAMGEKQGLLNVVDAARLATTTAPHVRFVLVGDGGQRARVASAAAGVERLELRDPTAEDDYPRLLAAADVLLVNERPGLLEMAVPSKLTSYFSSGRPVLAATETGSTTAGEVTAAGAGLVVPPGDPAALLDGVARLVADPVAADSMGAAGLDYCRRVLSPDASLDAYDRWVRSLAEGRGRR